VTVRVSGLGGVHGNVALQPRGVLDSLKSSNPFPTFTAEMRGVATDLKVLLRLKGVFPYEWFNSPSRLQETALPPQSDFHSDLTQEDIGEDDYALAQEVWKKAGCSTFADYLTLYLKTDVVLLADVFEAFRTMCTTYYGLDPCHYFTLPGFSWDAMLKMTGVKIACFKEGEDDMLAMVQRGMRGGISMISTRYAEANNPLMTTYNPEEPTSHLMYLDANNLYGWAMSQALPLGDYKWANPASMTTRFICDLPDDVDRGYILEVDLEVPVELHDKFNDYPLAPETTLFDASPRMEALRVQLAIAKGTTTKLIPNLHNKPPQQGQVRASLPQFEAVSPAGDEADGGSSGNLVPSDQVSEGLHRVQHAEAEGEQERL